MCSPQFDAGQSCQPYFNVYENNIFRYTSKPSEGIVPTFKRQLHTNMAYVAGWGRFVCGLLSQR
jgi:hypothetical protein